MSHPPNHNTQTPSTIKTTRLITNTTNINKKKNHNNNNNKRIYTYSHRSSCSLPWVWGRMSCRCVWWPRSPRERCRPGCWWSCWVCPDAFSPPCSSSREKNCKGEPKQRGTGYIIIIHHQSSSSLFNTPYGVINLLNNNLSVKCAIKNQPQARHK